MDHTSKPTLMQLEFSLPKKILLSFGIMISLILLVYYFSIPNPNVILIAGLVFCCALFGFGGGIVAAVILFFYTLFFFSTDHSFFRFTTQNLQKVISTLIGITIDTLLICYLKKAEVQDYAQVRIITKKLHRENELLQNVSLKDELTGLRNRLALRQDYDRYQNHSVTVMMLDLDHFKSINDTRGHDEGDRVLSETGKLLSDTFGNDYCYRYGGDEFLVIFPDKTEAEFQDRLEGMLENKPFLTINGEPERVGFSIGYIHDLLNDPDMLRSLISAADERMYQTKREKVHIAIVKDRSEFSPRSESPLPKPEYTVEEIKTFLKKASGQYALARIVDPIECRILELGENNEIHMKDVCYSIWDSKQRCLNCSSASACKTGCHHKKVEHFEDKTYYIHSNPINLKLPGGEVYKAVVELVNVKADSPAAPGTGNNRSAENIGNRASHYQSLHDSLTRVLNADSFYELSRKEILKAHNQSWVMVTSNIMNFRLVNTLFGVLKGNEVLIRTASLLHDIAEDAHGLCGRLGSDQFALLLPTDAFRENELINTADSLAKTFNSGIYTFCIHFGVYRIDDPSIPISVMCGRANSALRTIRENMAKTIAYFDDKILEKVLLEQTIISGFEDALKEGQFQMYLQPMVRENGTVLGAEALVRWCKPDSTVLFPGVFIEILERAGLISRLDVYIWELAVKQLSAWKQTDKKDLTISVNMSAIDFYSIDVYDVLVKLVEKYKVDSRLLRLEITETALLTDPSKSDEIVSRLRKKGFIVEIDDFGKGYSSLSLLKNIQADVLKIDMGFLHEINDRQRSRTILEAVINLAGSLGMDVIAEGVETDTQLSALTSMGCHHFQGYYFSRPIPVPDFENQFEEAGKQEAM